MSLNDSLKLNDQIDETIRQVYWFYQNAEPGKKLPVRLQERVDFIDGFLNARRKLNRLIDNDRLEIYVSELLKQGDFKNAIHQARR